MSDQPPKLDSAVPVSSGTAGVGRRAFLSLLGAAATMTASPTITRARGNPHVVVVGGGFGGATAAKYLRTWGGGSIQVTMVDPDPYHYSCIQSSLALTGQMTMDDIRFSLPDLADTHGFTLVQDSVEGIDAANGQVRLAGGGTLSYDRLILSPGTAFKPVEGLDQSLVPHAWLAGPQTDLLRRQIADMPDNGTFVLTIPPAPYRCPPGPYERTCLVADWLQQRGGGRVVLLDANPDIVVIREPFHAAFKELYGDIVEYYPSTVLNSVDSPGKTVITSAGDFTGDVVNVIPTHRAPDIIRNSGLTAGGDWAPVHGLTFESSVDGFKGIHVIGDSQGLKLPKAGHIATAEAKVCVDAVVRLLAGKPVDSADRVANIVLNSACLNEVSSDQSLFLTAAYAYRAAPDDPWNGKFEHVHEGSGSAKTWSRKNHSDLFMWWENLSRDVFT